MKNKINKHSKIDEVPGGTKADSKTPDSSGETKIKKEIVAEPIQKPTRLYFSSPCLLSEMEDDEDFLNQ